ncbi:PA14 domain-containing protein [Planctomycetota bacterium]
MRYVLRLLGVLALAYGLVLALSAVWTPRVPGDGDRRDHVGLSAALDRGTVPEQPSLARLGGGAGGRAGVTGPQGLEGSERGGASGETDRPGEQAPGVPSREEAGQNGEGGRQGQDGVPGAGGPHRPVVQNGPWNEGLGTSKSDPEPGSQGSPPYFQPWEPASEPAPGADADVGDEAEEAPLGEDPPPGVGLLGKYFDHDGSLAKVPSLEGLEPTFSRLDPLIDFEEDASFRLPFAPESFAVLWTGYIWISEGGPYFFGLASDDGALLSIDNRRAIDNDGIHSLEMGVTMLELNRGFHVVRLAYFENYQTAAAILRYGRSEDRLEVIPTDLLYPPGGAADEYVPVVDSVEPAAMRRGQEFVIEGSGFSDIPTYNDVSVGGLPAEVLQAGRQMLVVETPVAAEHGPLVVTVGSRSSIPFLVHISSYTGLHGRYCRLPNPIPSEPFSGPYPPTEWECLAGPVQLTQGTSALRQFRGSGYLALFSGQVFAERDGRYRFFVTGGAHRLAINGEVLLDSTNGASPPLHSSRVELVRGWHTIDIEVYHEPGPAVVSLAYQPPGGSRGLIPAGLLSPPDSILRVDRPVVSRVAPDRGPPGTEVAIEGSGFVFPGCRTRVTVDGVSAEIATLEWNRVVGSIPDGANTGDLVAWVGPLASDPSRFRVQGLGLLGEYCSIPPEALSTCEFDVSEPALVRVDDRICFDEMGAFELPFASSTSTVAARWRGDFIARRNGEYTFLVGSSDGSVLWIDGQIVVFNDLTHPYREVQNKVVLNEGTHPVELRFFGCGHAQLHLLVQAPGEDMRLAKRSDFALPWDTPPSAVDPSQ